MQVVGYTTGTVGEPATIDIAAEGGVQSEQLEPGRRLEFSLGDRHCAGSLGDTEHERCENESAPYCADHQDMWACARCTGNCALPLDACHEAHAIYLAAFAPDTFKVGVTRSWRLETRLREQGADRAAHVNTVKNGRIARQVEADIARDMTDRVRVPRKVAGLHRTVDDASWHDLLSDFEIIETFDLEYGFTLEHQPVTETMARGTVIGTKGRVLVVERDGTTYATDLRNLIGYELTKDGAIDEDRQSSLASFE